MTLLLRVFLEWKLKDEEPKAVRRIVARAVDNLIQHELWDEARVDAALL